MFFTDLGSILQWWITIFIIGIIFIPMTNSIFSNFVDKGYIFSKIIGIVFISYAAYILASLRILPFETQGIFLIIGIFILVNIFIKRKIALSYANIKPLIPKYILEECIFLIVLILWAFIHAHQPNIYGLEKYMDYGFINSILRTKYFPPLDMWLTPFSINYYYFGHLATAVLTKLSFISSEVTFNLMLSTLAGLGFASSFSIAINLLKEIKPQISNFKIIIGGLTTAFLLNFAGNLHIIYAFFKSYGNENPVPFWQLLFSPFNFPNNYWYPNATRFISRTIHEFPGYSNVVSDLHGHFLDIPFVLLAIAVLLGLFLKSKLKIDSSLQNWLWDILLISFLLAIMYMTNAWDGFIYFMLSSIIIVYLLLKPDIIFPEIKNKKLKVSNLALACRVENLKVKIKHSLIAIAILAIGFFIFTLPFNLTFKPFTSGIGILCAPEFLTYIGKVGPFIFESEHCDHSPLWQLLILYGFFYFWVISFIIFLHKKISAKFEYKNLKQHQNFNKSRLFKISDLGLSIYPSDIFVLILILLSSFLIVLPEFAYVKDIYPAHYRANTMFKLVYQAFIMLSLSSGYIIMRIYTDSKLKIINSKYIYCALGLLILFLVSIYPYLAVKAYFGSLKNYSGLNGTNYLKFSHSDAYEAISWINKNIHGQPVILEAQGDSYTDYARVSTNTGLPTVLGWTVHEWLWRGTYDVPAPRIVEVQKMYESTSIKETESLLKKYNVKFIFIGDLEREKYPSLDEEKFNELGKVIYQIRNTKIFEVN